MAGRGPAPSENRRRRVDPERGDWSPAADGGWQHGDIPKPPSKLLKASREAWDVWFKSWFASHWGPSDLPGLRQVIRLYDQVERGEFQRANELRLQMDTYGITPKGQQDRRWKPPQQSEEQPDAGATPKPPSGPYGHLRDVSKGA